MWLYTLAIALVVSAHEVNGEPHMRPSSAMPLNSTLTSTLPPQEEHSSHNETDWAEGSRISTILRDLPTIKGFSISICVLTVLLITCLVIKICRSAKKIRKTRKYDIITTPAERVEMAPLNEDNDEDEDSTLFDVKYKWITFCAPSHCWRSLLTPPPWIPPCEHIYTGIVLGLNLQWKKCFVLFVLHVLIFQTSTKSDVSWKLFWWKHIKLIKDYY